MVNKVWGKIKLESTLYCFEQYLYRMLSIVGITLFPYVIGDIFFPIEHAIFIIIVSLINSDCNFVVLYLIHYVN